MPYLKEVEIELKRRNPQIFKDFTLLQIRNAIELVLNEAEINNNDAPVSKSKSENQPKVGINLWFPEDVSTQMEKSYELFDKSRDSWVFDDMPDYSEKIIEILESDKRLTEQIKKTFFIALTNGHIDRATQLKRACSDINFNDEIQDAFYDAHISGKKFLPQEIAKLHPKLSYEELLAGAKSRTEQ